MTAPADLAAVLEQSATIKRQQLDTLINRAIRLRDFIARNDSWSIERMELALGWAIDAYVDDDLPGYIDSAEYQISFGTCHCRGCWSGTTEHDGDPEHERETIEAWADRPASMGRAA